MPEVVAGDRAPEFTLESDHGALSLGELLSRGKLVLAFYYEDLTPTCSTEVSSLKEGFEVFQELGAGVLAVSSDSMESHDLFRGRLGGLPFPLASDSRPGGREGLRRRRRDRPSRPPRRLRHRPRRHRPAGAASLQPSQHLAVRAGVRGVGGVGQGQGQGAGCRVHPTRDVAGPPRGIVLTSAEQKPAPEESALCTLYPALCTPHSVPRTLYPALCTLHSDLTPVLCST